MKFLFTSSGGYGHFLPLVPLAEALAGGGHEIGFAVPASFAPVVERAGFRAFPLDGHEEGSGGSGLEGLTPSAHSKAAVARYLAQAVSHTPQLTAIARHWRPGALIRETTAWAGWLAGELLGLPVAVFDFEPTPSLLLAMTLGLY